MIIKKCQALSFFYIHLLTHLQLEHPHKNAHRQWNFSCYCIVIEAFFHCYFVDKFQFFCEQTILIGHWSKDPNRIEQNCSIYLCKHHITGAQVNDHGNKLCALLLIKIIDIDNLHHHGWQHEHLHIMSEYVSSLISSMYKVLIPAPIFHLQK